VDKLTAVEAHLAGMLALPPGYRVAMVPPGFRGAFDADLMELRRPDGTLVEVFSARGAAPAEVVRAAEEDHRRHGRSTA
jgi:hypothetical protein